MSMQVKLPIIEHREIATDHYELVLPRVASFDHPSPGQFLSITCRDETSLDPLLRRPFSFYRVGEDTFSVVYRVVGRGTAALARFRPGQKVDVLGPLGQGYAYDFVDRSRRVVLVGGGVGIPPLFHLSQELIKRQVSFDVLVGFATQDYVIGVNDWQSLGVQPAVATDDGSTGHHGLVTDLLREALTPDVVHVYACGPRPMLAAVSQIAGEAGVAVQVSMEEWMGCGVGACLSCVCSLKTETGRTLARICYEGPVFDGGKVVWHE